MIRTNLSTRPFYNQHAVRFWLSAIALGVIVATAFNVSRIARYSSSDTTLATQASQDEARAATLRQQASRLRASVDPKQVDFVSAEAHQANDLIDRRTFSWTELFNRFETTLPDDVRISSVRPKLDSKRGIVLTVAVAAKSVEDVSTFMERLESTGAFANLYTLEEHFDDQGLLISVLESTYVPGAAKPSTPSGAAQ